MSFPLLKKKKKKILHSLSKKVESREGTSYDHKVNLVSTLPKNSRNENRFIIYYPGG